MAGGIKSGRECRRVLLVPMDEQGMRSPTKRAKLSWEQWPVVSLGRELQAPWIGCRGAVGMPWILLPCGLKTRLHGGCRG